jgi:hypothetical protein
MVADAVAGGPPVERAIGFAPWKLALARPAFAALKLLARLLGR